MAVGRRVVGRRDEFALLQARWSEAREGSGRLVVLSGRAGLGKTRLVEELAAAAAAPVGWGAATDDPGAPPLWPWSRALRDLPGPSAALAAARSLGTTGASVQEAAAAEFVAHARVLDEIEFACAAEGLLLVLEDLHWSDESTLRLLDRLATVIRRFRLLAVATHRPVASGGLSVALPALLARPGTETLRLRPLTAADAGALLGQEVASARPEAIAAVVDQAGGNPLYLCTVARIAPELLRVPGEPVGRLPELRELVAGAVHALGGEAAGVLEALSVLGSEAAADLLAQVLGVEPDGVLASVRPAVVAGLVVEFGGGRIGFAHVLLRDAVYARIEVARLAGLHRRAAEALAARAAQVPGLAGEVANHWQRAGDRQNSLNWGLRAAETATAAGAHAEAAGYLRTALPLSRDDAERVTILLDLARAQYLSGSIRDAFASAQAAAHDPAALVDPTVAARAAVIVQGVADPELTRPLGVLCRDALRGLANSDRLDLRAELEAQLAHVARVDGDLVAALRWSELAVRDAAASGSAAAELDAICARGPLILVPGQAAERLDLGSRAIELARCLNRPLAELWGHTWRSDAHVELADVASAQAELLALGRLADRSRLPLVRWHLLRQRAAWAMLRGQFGESRAYSAAATDLAAELADGSAPVLHSIVMMAIAYLRGDPAPDLPPAAQQLLDSPPTAVPVLQQAARAFVLLQTDRRAEAEAAYAALPLELLDPADPLSLPLLVHVIDLAVEFPTAADPLPVLETLRALRRQAPAAGTGSVCLLGSVARALGRVELAGGSPAAAIPALEEGIGVDLVLGARPYVVQGRLALATALRLRAHPGDHARSRDLSRRAREEALRLDMPGSVRTADALLRETSERRATDGLTVREREVATLVVDALSNREIAARLVLSERTVEGHVRSILAKTGLASRTELIRALLSD